MYMPRVGSVCVLLRQRAPSPFPPLPCLGGITCCTCRGLARCVPYGRGGYLTWRVVTVTRHHIMQRDFKIIEKSAMWDVRCQYFVRLFSQVYKSGGRTVQLYQRYVSAVKREGPEPNPHTVHGTVVDFSVLWWTSITQPDEEEVTAGRQVDVRAMQRVRRVCRGMRAAGCLRRRIVVGLQGGNASRQVLKIG